MEPKIFCKKCPLPPAQYYCYGYCHYYGSRSRQASPRECSCNPMHASPIVRAVHVRVRARELVSKRSL